MQKPTTHDLHIMLTEMRGDIKSILHEQITTRERLDEHERKDEERFGSLNKCAASIALVASAIGAGCSCAISWFKT